MKTLFLLCASALLWGCSQATSVQEFSDSPLPAPTLQALPPTSTPESLFLSDGGGEPRSAGYWLLWNGCAPENRAETAAANGGREAGWIIMDDLLADPGISLGEHTVATCEQGIELLEGAKSGDPAYSLAAQTLAAQLNLAAGAEYCPAVEQAVQAGHLLLFSLDFDGSGVYLLEEGSEDYRTAVFLAEQLASYNAGQLCR